MPVKSKRKKAQKPENAKTNMQNEADNLKDHFFSAIKGEINGEPKDASKDIPHVNIHSLRYLP